MMHNPIILLIYDLAWSDEFVIHNPITVEKNYLMLLTFD
jgi:hypothetical protein